MRMRHWDAVGRSKHKQAGAMSSEEGTYAEVEQLSGLRIIDFVVASLVNTISIHPAMIKALHGSSH